MFEVADVCLGSSSFDKTIAENAAFVDKTLFIKEFIESRDEVSVILRPRRFGKSLNLSALKSFLSHGAKKESFDRFLIGGYPEFVEKHCGKYAVIYLDLKDCKGGTWEIQLAKIRFAIAEMFQRHSDVLGQEVVAEFGAKKPLTLPEVSSSLKILTSLLKDRTGLRVVVLIDEYDAPVNCAYQNGYLKDASSFFGPFFAEALKGNENLKCACMMGIVELQGTSILSELNNKAIYSVKDQKYSGCFGFTRDEIEPYVPADVRGEFYDWYNGYRMGSVDVVNPWAFFNWFKTKVFESYWTHTGYLGTIKKLIGSHVAALANGPEMSLLLSRQKIGVSDFKAAVNYNATSQDLNSFLHFMVLTGYLTYSASNGPQVWIPNREVLLDWTDQLNNLFSANTAIRNTDVGSAIANAAIHRSPESFDALRSALERMLLNFSYYDLAAESSYHVLFVATVISGLSKDIVVTSNVESGHGRYDIAVEFPRMRRAVVFELKKAKSEANLDDSAAAALEQIQNGLYYNDFCKKGFECVLVGVSFFSKKVSSLKTALVGRCAQ